jgi:hypothetical protein
MADHASRAWDLSDDAFLASFTSLYPQPGSWVHLCPRSEMVSALTSALLSKRPEPESFLPPEPPSAAGLNAGVVSSAASDLSSRQIPFAIRTSNSSTTTTKHGLRSSLFSLPDYVTDVSPAVDQRGLHRWKTLYEPFRRNARWTDGLIRPGDPGPLDLTFE